MEQMIIDPEQINKRTRLVSVQYLFYGCDPAQLDDEDEIRKLTLRFVKISGMQIVGKCFHKFSPQGITGGALGIFGVLYLAESHFFIHTWPELSFAYVHVAACQPKNLLSAVKYLKSTLKHTKCVRKILLGKDYLKGEILNENLLGDYQQ